MNGQNMTEWMGNVTITRHRREQFNSFAVIIERDPLFKFLTRVTQRKIKSYQSERKKKFHKIKRMAIINQSDNNNWSARNSIVINPKTEFA